jgi:hypothetical protein
MAAIGLARPDAPELLGGALREAGRAMALLAAAVHPGIALPVGQRRQVRRHARLEMPPRCRPQPLTGPPLQHPRLLAEAAGAETMTASRP